MLSQWDTQKQRTALYRDGLFYRVGHEFVKPEGALVWTRWRFDSSRGLRWLCAGSSGGMPPDFVMQRPRVVIVGAGFGGLACARRLAGRPVDVVLIDRHNYHLFTPLLYQVATALLNPSDIAYPVRAVFRGTRNVRVMLDEVVGADLESRVVKLRSAPRSFLSYDYLVLACGSTNHFFGMDQLAATAFPLKDLSEGMALRNHVLACFEKAAQLDDPEARKPWMTFVLVGGGPTGVELAGAFSELIRLVLVKDFPELDMKQVRIVLVEARDRVLPTFPAELGQDAKKRLERRQIEVRLGTRLERVEGDEVLLSGGERIVTKTLVWAAGVRPAGLVEALGLPATKSGRVAVDQALRVQGHDRVFAIGDIAAVPYGDGEMPMLSAPAIQEGRFVADAILKLERGLDPGRFRYRDKGIMATIGRNAAVAQLGKLRFKGFVGWIMWLVVHLYFIIGFRNRISVLLEWAWDYFRYDRPIRLIERAKQKEGAP
ncbi:MAG: pyridine nucleotide-disulfide oxidoreductase [Gemmatimonadales bacterium]|nr:MAG: pyridine nucleotide-disulfide oxidoreductase [Gemmatimonadales bacterium]